MNARELIIQSDFTPEQRADVLRVLEDAWRAVRESVGSEIAPASARIKLSGIILLLTYVIKNDPDRLRDAAVRVFKGKGPPSRRSQTSKIEETCA